MFLKMLFFPWEMVVTYTNGCKIHQNPLHHIITPHDGIAAFLYKEATCLARNAKLFTIYFTL